jgi:hypothetical protein
MQSVLGSSPLERGAFSIVEMEEAGCVKIRIADRFKVNLTGTIPYVKILFIFY